MDRTFYPFVEPDGTSESAPSLKVRNPARIAVYDDPAAAPRVVMIEPQEIRSYLEEITATVTRLAKEQGGSIPFTVIRECVENLIHAYFIEPTISILEGGDLIRFSDQGPGIREKERALEYGTTSATDEMKRYIRGVGSGLPYAQQWLNDKGGSLTIDDNISRGTVVTISLVSRQKTEDTSKTMDAVEGAQMGGLPPQLGSWGQAAPGYQGVPQQGLAWAGQQMGFTQQSYPPYQQPSPYQQAAQPWPQQAWPQQVAYGGMGYGAQNTMGMPTQPWQGGPAQQMAPALSLDEREQAAMSYLMSHDSVGPRDLNEWMPASESTWSRVLAGLESKGLLAKQGQKRRLTDQGRLLLGM